MRATQCAVQVLLRHGAGGDDFAKLVESQKRNRKGARPLSFQAAAGGHIKVPLLVASPLAPLACTQPWCVCLVSLLLF
jgi:hypothetical protein